MSEFNINVGPRRRTNLDGVVVSKNTLDYILAGLEDMRAQRGEIENLIAEEQKYLAEHAVYKALCDLRDEVLLDEISAEEAEYRNGRWWLRGNVSISVPTRGNYMVLLTETSGGAVRVGNERYTTGEDINIEYEGVEEISFVAEGWVSISLITIREEDTALWNRCIAAIKEVDISRITPEELETFEV